ncbi:phospholipase A2 family protein [Brevibacillus agri]|uniref:phospholipase n=1 Tax=Brevibacillus agri TaxID=51101 RepID=UPI002E1FD4A2|nr:phospholipase A2 family protein [Brevibacillus agri]MED1657127.1 phospholipase A2 family protein [Brevibacillus agri]MED1688896.1 phospholipase A2 family protein [Brevibacillus agri]MED1693662.1 phospholipase A2 family protein [Brevibacillus agri]MED1698730.1 phospholipase A2 family protein [Brevibacillus agri]
MGRRRRRAGRIPCLYGNWCGPGCSEPGAPIDDIDRCCKKHDRCYQKRGYFSCSCDQELLRCLQNKIDMNTEKGRVAAMISAYFSRSKCIPDDLK